ncbi:MAG: hypothetical protein AAGB34_02010 [Planctomycetota bacterium]
MNTKVILIAAGAAMMCGFSSAQDELLRDPGIEAGFSGDPRDISPWGTFGAAGVNRFFGDNGHLSFFSDAPGNSGGAFQGGIAGQAGIEYTFTLVDVRIESNFNANMRFGLEFYEADDATKIDEVFVDLDTAADLTPLGEVNGGTFQMSATAVAGTVFVRPVIIFDGAAPLGQGQANLFVFEASLIPAPGAGFLGIAGSCLLARRRR